jgi:membrane protease YdiL (CAAX protease family)
MEGGVQPVPWTPRETFWRLLATLLVAIIVPPLLVAPFDPKLKSDGALLTAQAIFDGILLVFAIGIASGWNFGRWREGVVRLGMRRFAPNGLLLAFGVLIAYYICAGLFATYVLKPDQQDIGGDLGVGNPSIVIAVTAVLEIVVLAPIAEELFFRGFLFGGLRSSWDFLPAALVTGLIFGVVHAPTGPTAAIPLAGLGFALCFIYERTGSIWPCIAVHALNNGIALAVIH